jgi:hypothetical protein
MSECTQPGSHRIIGRSPFADSVCEAIEDVGDDVSSGIIITGTSPGTGNTAVRIELDANASAVDGAYDPAEIYIVGGTGAGQARQIYQYVGASKYAYINRAWKVIPDNTSQYYIVMHSGNSHVNEGIAQGGGASTITLNALASTQNNLYLGQMIFISAGTGQDQARMCIGYNGTTKVATVDAPWIVQPDTTSVYAMFPYPGFVHGVPSADVATNVLVRDVIGNKSDVANETADQASLVGLSRKILEEVEEVEGHFHNVNRAWGALGAPDETNAIEANVNRPFVAVSGNNTWGTAIPILGASDNPVLAAQTDFDPHEILVVDTDHTTPYRIRLIYGNGTSGAAITAGQWSEIMFIASGGPFDAGVPAEIRMPVIPVGWKLWAQVWNATNLSEVDFFWEAHGYPAP